MGIRSVSASRDGIRECLLVGESAGVGDLVLMAEETHREALERMAKNPVKGGPMRPAATVILLRNGQKGPETLMLRKASKIAFGNMWVFPGGRVDAADCAGLDPCDDLAAARVAAVREVEEETSIRINADGLLPFSHWTPPPVVERRFATWFFLTQAPSSEVVIDHGEIRDFAWMTPSLALQRHDAGEIEVAPPTFVTLWELTRWSAVSNVLQEVQNREPFRYATRFSPQPDALVSMWQGDAGWESGDASLHGKRHRLVMPEGSRWQYIRDPEG